MSGEDRLVEILRNATPAGCTSPSDFVLGIYAAAVRKEFVLLDKQECEKGNCSGTHAHIQNLVIREPFMIDED